ncbi:MAG: SUMF1/EgtB/PvdO family nonheme iron enzyme, partial [Planctomycetota bacterium]
YFDYANGSDTPPVSDHPDDNPSAANYFNNDNLPNGFNDGYAVTGSTELPPAVPTLLNPLTEVGAYTAAQSPYGTFDQNGNVWEWNESTLAGSSDAGPNRSHRGGSWFSSPSGLTAPERGFDGHAPDEGRNDMGFRIAAAAWAAGDANGDGVVDLLDFDVLAQRFGDSIGFGIGAGPEQGDFNGDGIVDLLDFDILAQNFGVGAAAAIPEPSGAAVVGVGLCVWGRRRNRNERA